MNKFSFKKNHPASMRWWHWLNALAILGLLSTVLLRKTFLSWRTNAAFIESKVQEAGGTVTPEVAKSIAQGLRDVMWEWHYYIGFFLAALLVARLLIGLFIVKKSPASDVLQGVAEISKASPKDRMEAIHYTLVKTGYALFYLVTLYMVLSGLAMYWEHSLGLSEEFADVLKEIHETMMWFFVVFIVGHIAGVVIAENRGDRGLTSGMISGGDN